MNIYDISKQAGVSIATVSRVINNSENVSEKTRKKVLDVMEHVNYTPNVFARGLMLQNSKIIGVLCANSSDIYLANAVYHIEQLLRVEGYDCILCCTGYEQEEKEKYMKLLLSKKVDAIILVGSSYVEKEKQKQKYIYEAAKKLPITLINSHLSGTNIYCSYCDDKQAVQEAVQGILKSGSKQVLFLYDALSYSGKKKLEGYKSALKAHRGATELLMYCNSNIETVIEKLKELDEKGVAFDSVMATEDYLAIAALKYAQHKKLKVPEAFQIIGYNNSVLTKCCEPELTSVDNKVANLCENAVQNLISVLHEAKVPQNNRITCTLKKRNTTRF